MDQPPRRSRYFEVEAPARPLRKRPRPGETARLEALRSYLAARGVSRAEDVLRWTVEVTRRAGGRSAGTLDAYFVDGAARYRSRADVARRASKAFESRRCVPGIACVEMYRWVFRKGTPRSRVLCGKFCA